MPRSTTNLMPLILEAVRAYATLGETCDALREVWGEYMGNAHRLTDERSNPEPRT